MPVNIIPEECMFCGEEVTVFVRGSSCGYANVLIVSCSCLGCQERKAAEKSEASELRGDEAVGDGGDEPSDVVREEEKRGHHVYELIDQRDASVFYVGVTMNQTGRFYDHGAPNSTSAALPRIQEIRQSGADYEMRVVATFADRQRAEAFEAILISQYPNALNRAKPPLRTV